jgi:hypothetical protein
MANAWAGDTADPAVARALVGTIERNIAHGRDWLGAGDFKSLAQCAGGLEILAGLLQAQGDGAAWQEAAGRVVREARAVRSAAQADDASAAETALARLADARAALETLTPSGQPLPPPKANLRSLMLLMDSVRGEAKIALIAGNGPGAKNQAYVLSELGRVVSKSRSGQRWSQLSEEFTAASLAAARAASVDAAELRPLLRVVSERCEACHDSR